MRRLFGERANRTSRFFCQYCKVEICYASITAWEANLKMKTAILDEAGDVGFGVGASEHLLVAVAIVSSIERLRKTVMRVRKRLDKRRRDIPEFKAFKTDPRIIRRLLTQVASVDCEIVIVVADKRAIAQPDDPETLYRRLCAQAARRCVERYRQVTLILDKRYTDPHLAQMLAEAISSGLEGVTGVLAIEPPRDSQQEKAIQAVDAVAWAIFQRLEHDDPSFYELVKEKIVSEEWLK